MLPSLPLDLLDKILQLDPKRRPTAAEALEHKWLDRIDAKSIQLPQLPGNQDCHEMWSKKIKKSGHTYNSYFNIEPPKTNDTVSFC